MPSNTRDHQQRDLRVYQYIIAVRGTVIGYCEYIASRPVYYDVVYIYIYIFISNQLVSPYHYHYQRHCIDWRPHGDYTQNRSSPNTNRFIAYKSGRPHVHHGIEKTNFVHPSALCRLNPSTFCNTWYAHVRGEKRNITTIPAWISLNDCVYVHHTLCLCFVCWTYKRIYWYPAQHRAIRNNAFGKSSLCRRIIIDTWICVDWFARSVWLLN